MPGMTVLDPRGEETAESVRLAPRLDNLKGKKLGIVLDGPWRSWYVFSDRMEEIIDDSGQECTVERIELVGSAFDRSGVKHTAHGLRPDEKEKLANFAGTVDAVIVGLGN
jgi:hypothetical protein